MEMTPKVLEVILTSTPYHRALLLKLLSMNDNTYDRLLKQGIVETSMSYQQVLSTLHAHYSRKKGISPVEGEEREKGAMLTLEKLQEDILYTRERRIEVEIRNLQTRNEYIDKGELNDLISPFLMAVHNKLNELGATNPTMIPFIDEVFDAFTDLGHKLAQNCKPIKDDYA
jgi:hypothetical protein